jgi:hypothetical protein
MTNRQAGTKFNRDTITAPVVEICYTALVAPKNNVGGHEGVSYRMQAVQ